VARKDLILDGRPGLLYGYGGRVLRVPSTVRPGRLAREGGVYVVANIRGGGEFGRSAQALSRRTAQAYEDFIAVAEDSSAQVTSTPTRIRG